MIWYVAAAALVAVVFWAVRRDRRRERDADAALSQQPQRTPAPQARAHSTQIEIDLRVLNVSDELQQQIANKLRAGGDPDDVELPSAWHGHALRVVGESFDNPNGTSRQQIIATTELGTMAFLLPEPDNPHDPNAVRVFVSRGGQATAQIGFLPRGQDDVVDDVRGGRIAAWFAGKDRADNGLWGATLYLVRSSS